MDIQVKMVGLYQNLEMYFIIIIIHLNKIDGEKTIFIILKVQI